jgi:hypothetical protein
MQDILTNSALKSTVKKGSTVAMLAAIILYIWHTLAPLPAVLNPVFPVICAVLVIHGIEGIVGAALILFNRLSPPADLPSQSQSELLDHLPNNTLLAVLKAGLYTFFVGTVGLSEIMTATRKPQP